MDVKTMIKRVMKDRNDRQDKRSMEEDEEEQEGETVEETVKHVLGKKENESVNLDNTLSIRSTKHHDTGLHASNKSISPLARWPTASDKAVARAIASFSFRSVRVCVWGMYIVDESERGT
jgi:hypothetical protein